MHKEQWIREDNIGENLRENILKIRCTQQAKEAIVLILLGTSAIIIP